MARMTYDCRMARKYTPDPRSIALGVEVRADMDARDITVTDMAARLDVDRGTLGDWLGARRPMPITMFWALAGELRVPSEELVRRAEERARRDSHQV